MPLISLCDELLLMLLEGLDSLSLLKCRQTGRLLYRISFDRILLSKLNAIEFCNNGERELLLYEQVIMDSIVNDKDIDWKWLMDIIVKRKFQQVERLMPDNSFQSFLTVKYLLISIPWNTIYRIFHDPNYKVFFHALKSIGSNSDLALTIYATFVVIWDALKEFNDADILNLKAEQFSNPMISNFLSCVIYQCRKKGFDIPSTANKMWAITAYMVSNAIDYNRDDWDAVYHRFDKFSLPDRVPSFWAISSLENNVSAAEYKRLFQY
jgi:hypothetical protein